MSSFFERHPEQDLVRYLDGELSQRRARKVASHLESCGPCRADVEELQNTLAECARYAERTGSADTGSATTLARPVPRFFTN